MARQAFAQHIQLSNRYNWELTNQLVTALAQRNGVKQENIVLGAGSTEIIDLVLRLAAAKKGNFVTAEPSYPYWMDTAQALQLQKNTVPLTPDKKLNLPAMLRAINTETQLLYICNPNNPTGTVCDPEELVQCIERAPKHTIVLVDEAYLDFTDHASISQLVLQHQNLVVAKTFSKIYGLAGARVGYGMAHSSTIERLNALQSWPNGSVSVASTAAAIASLEDKLFVADTYLSNQKVRQYTLEQLERLGLRAIPSFSNFVYFSLDHYKKDFFQQLKNNNVLGTRIYEDQGKWTRITIGTQAEMQVFISAIE